MVKFNKNQPMKNQLLNSKFVIFIVGLVVGLGATYFIGKRLFAPPPQPVFGTSVGFLEKLASFGSVTDFRISLSFNAELLNYSEADRILTVADQSKKITLPVLVPAATQIFDQKTGRPLTQSDLARYAGKSAFIGGRLDKDAIIAEFISVVTE
jgi:hypothetical protein